MMENIWYWTFATCVAILSLYITGLIVSRIIHVHNGRSMLDADAPAGLRLRKWFLISLGVSTGVRCIFTAVEELFVAYWPIKTSTVWILRCLPSILFLLTAAFVTHYLGNLYYSLQGSEGHKFRYFWLVVTLLFALAEFVCVSVLSAVSWQAYLHLLHISFLILAVHGGLILCIIWYFALSVWRSLAMKQQNAQTSKVLVRMLMLVTTVTISLLTMTLLRADEYEVFSEEREMDIKSGAHFFLLLVGESLSGLLMVLVMTNALQHWETQMRSSWYSSLAVAGSNTSNANTSSSTNPSTGNNVNTTSSNNNRNSVQMTAKPLNSGGGASNPLLSPHNASNYGSGGTAVGLVAMSTSSNNNNSSNSSRVQNSSNAAYQSIPQLEQQ